MNNQMNQYNNVGTSVPSNSGKGMVWHNIFLVFCVLSILGSLGQISSKIIDIVFMGVMAIFLWKKTNVGYILCMVYNWFCIITGGLLAMVSYTLFSGASSFEQYLEEFYKTIDGLHAYSITELASIFLIASILTIVFGILNMIYYKKRKYLFVNSLTGDTQPNMPLENGIQQSNMPQQPNQSQPTNSNVCPYCGTPKVEEASFCSNCGAKF